MNHINLTKEQKQEWQQWVEGRPPQVQELCKKLPPEKLYRLTTTDHIVTVYSYGEDGTVTVNVLNKYNQNLNVERRVFGIKPEDLVECDFVPCHN